MQAALLIGLPCLPGNLRGEGRQGVEHKLLGVVPFVFGEAEEQLITIAIPVAHKVKVGDGAKFAKEFHLESALLKVEMFSEHGEVVFFGISPHGNHPALICGFDSHAPDPVGQHAERAETPPVLMGDLYLGVVL